MRTNDLIEFCTLRSTFSTLGITEARLKLGTQNNASVRFFAQLLVAVE